MEGTRGINFEFPFAEICFRLTMCFRALYIFRVIVPRFGRLKFDWLFLSFAADLMFMSCVANVGKNERDRKGRGTWKK